MKVVRVGLLAAAAFYLPYLGLWGWCITGMGGWSPVGSEFILMAALCLGLAAVLVGLAVLIPRRSRATGRILCVSGCFVLGFLVPSMAVAAQLRALGFRLAARRATPLVAAIHAYERATGGPPAQLSVLVPGYLPELPTHIPPVELIAGGEAARYGGNRWVLVAQVGFGILNWDEFLYFPNQQYPSEGFGGHLERMGDWAYVHE
ncbi:MAG TPA: hypothetical protein VFQ51_03800 [Vicinamibacteria bacterium]|nr:hypothetical protein [Vicinamibacteria bacterium]